MVAKIKNQGKNLDLNMIIVFKQKPILDKNVIHHTFIPNFQRLLYEFYREVSESKDYIGVYYYVQQDKCPNLT